MPERLRDPFARLSRLPLRRGDSDERDAGVSLMELVVTVLIFSLLLSAVTFSYQSWVTTAQESVNRTMAMQQGRLAIANLSRDARAALGYPTSVTSKQYPGCPGRQFSLMLDWASPFELAFYTADGVVTNSAKVTRVRYTLDDSGRLQRAERQVLPNATPETTTTVASYVRNPKSGPNAMPVFRYFRYADDESSEMTPTPATDLSYALGTGGCSTLWQLDDAQVIRIDLLMDVDTRTFVGQSILRTTVYVRSRGFWE